MWRSAENFGECRAEKARKIKKSIRLDQKSGDEYKRQKCWEDCLKPKEDAKAGTLKYRFRIEEHNKKDTDWKDFEGEKFHDSPLNGC